MQDGGNRGYMSRYSVCIDEVHVPRYTRISQGWIYVFLRPLLQVTDIRVCGAVRELAHILLQRSIHKIEAAGQKLRVVTWRGNVEPLVGTSGWIGDEVGE